MSRLARQNLPELTACALRERLAAGALGSRLPGVRPLSRELGVSIKTVRRALVLLESEGAVAPAMRGLPRSALPPGAPGGVKRALKVAVLGSRRPEDESSDTRSLLMQLAEAIRAGGHSVTMVQRPLPSDSANPKVLRRLVDSTGADAWIVYQAGVEPLAWFAGCRLPVAAFGGRGADAGLPSAYCDASQAMRETLARLFEAGHRRIVLIAPERALVPTPTRYVEVFAQEMRAHGVSVGAYHLPRWDETPEGLRTLLEALFRVTPPTALIVFGNLYMSGVLTFLAQRRLGVPTDVSLVSADTEGSFGWQWPGLKVAHFDDRRELQLKRLCRWVDDVAAGHPANKLRAVAARLVPGNSLGPAAQPQRRP